MALINCPECGKENVSDSAECCPVCGYPVKKHFDEIRQKKEEQEEYENRVNAVSMPTKPKFNKWAFYFGIMVLILGGLIILYYLFNAILGIISLRTGIAAIILILLLFGGMGGLFITSVYIDYNHAMDKYNLALKNFKEYQRHIIALEDINKQKKRTVVVKCPNCGSTNVEKISTGERILSVFGLGLASGKIGKQYYCKDCNYKW